MPHETEIKYTGVDFAALRLALQQAQASFLQRHWERNIVFDTPQRDMKQKGMLLRVRSKQWAKACGRSPEYVLTLKLPPTCPVPEDVKVWEERETRVHSFESTCSLVEGLGYEAAFRYDKVREEWQCDGVLVCLDTLVFGEVVEMEGEREAIFRLAGRLSLDSRQSTTETYHELNRRFRGALALLHDDNFYFTDEVAVRLLLESPCAGEDSLSWPRLTGRK